MNTYEGNLVANDIKIGIVVARFNEFITSKLLSGALDNLKRENVSCPGRHGTITTLTQP